MEGPLSDITILDLSRILSGPVAAMTLGDFGARVIKVEPPQGDDTRLWGPPFLGEDAAYFYSCNRNKESVQLNLKDDGDRAIFKNLVKQADVIIENFRPGTMARLGFGFPDLQQIKQDIILCSISGYGQSGPKATWPGFDQIAQGMSGLMSVTGEPDGPPERVGFSVADLSAAMWALFGIMVSLRHRDHTGEGQWVDVALVDAMISFQTYQAQNFFATGKSPTAHGSQHPNLAPYQAFKAKDGYFNIAVGNQSLWRNLCTALDLDLVDDSRFATNPDRIAHRDELIDLLQARFADKEVLAIVEKLNQSGVPAGPIYNVEQVFQDPHVLAREMLIEMHRDDTGPMKQIGVPVKLSRTPGKPRSAPPTGGEHSDAIKKEFRR